MNIDGSRVLVTGGAKRVGRRIVEYLAERGAAVWIHYHRSENQARELVRDLRRRGRHAELVRADLADVSAVRQLVQSVPTIDVLVNNASIFPRTPLDELTEATWDSVMKTNLEGPALLAIWMGRDMARRGSGVIVNITDSAVRRPYRHYLPYLVSKGGLEMLTRVLALELAPHVRVNAVAPGTVLLSEDTAPTLAGTLAERVPLKRLGSPEDVARAVAFLIESDYVTGAVLPVDGGVGL